MSQFQVACVGCGQTLLIEPNMFGQLVQCDGCGMQMQIPVPQPSLQEVVDAQPPQATPEQASPTPVTPVVAGGYPAHAHAPAGNLSNGLLLLIVGICILAAGAAMAMLGEIGLQYAGMSTQRVSRASFTPPPSMSGLSPAEHARQMRDYQSRLRSAAERRSSSIKFTSDIAKFGRGMHRFSRVLWLLGLGFLVGAFSVLITRFRFRRGLVIAALCVASVEVVLTLVIRVVPLFTDGPIRDHITMSVAPVLAGEVGLALLSLLLDLALVVELGLLAGALIGVSFIYQSKPLRQWMMRAVWLMGGWGSAILLLYIWVIINKSSDGALLYITWFLHWATNVALGVGMYMTIRFLINTRQQALRIGPA